MNLLYLIFPLALLIAAGFVVAFVWSARRGQFDDLDTPAMRALFDDEDELDTEMPRSVADEAAGADPDPEAGDAAGERGGGEGEKSAAERPESP